MLFKIYSLIYRKLYNITISKDSVFEGNINDLHSNCIKIVKKAEVRIGNNVKIKNCKIEVVAGKLIIEDNVTIKDYNISVGKNCTLVIGDNCIFEKKDNWRNPYIILWDNSILNIGHHNRLRCDFMCRFGGHCNIGKYNCINERTELRCDECIYIGSYNMISYNCRIWDTNTHSFYTDDTRRKMTEDMYPNIGAEKDKPKTLKVYIGNDNLIGENVAILKGTRINDNVKVGFSSVLSNKIIDTGKTVVGPSCRTI